MKKIINTTPHAITLISAETGETYSVDPTPGALLNAKAVEYQRGFDRFGNELVATQFVATVEAKELLTRLESENPDAIIIGSIIAAQAFPGRVYAMIPAIGFERVPPDQKKMRDDKFTIF